MGKLFFFPLVKFFLDLVDEVVLLQLFVNTFVGKKTIYGVFFFFFYVFCLVAN